MTNRSQVAQGDQAVVLSPGGAGNSQYLMVSLDSHGIEADMTHLDYYSQVPNLAGIIMVSDQFQKRCLFRLVAERHRLTDS